MSAGRRARQAGAGAVDGGPVVAGRVVRVLPDEPALNKTFDYLLPDALAGAAEVRLGTMVRVPLHGRRVGAWVVGVNVDPAVDRKQLLAVAKVSSDGPPRDLLSLAKWASWRWWGRPATFLTIASPNRSVRGSGGGGGLSRAALPPPAVGVELAAGLGIALAEPVTSAVRLGPAADPFPLLIEAVRAAGDRGGLILTPQVASAHELVRRFRRLGVSAAFAPDDWARAAIPGMVVVGARTAAWAPIADFGAAVVLDEHDEAYQDERAPTWHAREVVVERARRVGAPCLLVSPVPSPHALALAEGRVVADDRRTERDSWPIVALLDRSGEEPGRVPVVAPGLTATLRSSDRVVCVLNRRGRAKLLDCRSCGALAECERCGSAMQQQTEALELACGRCETRAPVVCRSCGGGRLRHLRPGTARLRDDLEALAQRPVLEVTGGAASTSDSSDGDSSTRAALPGDALTGSASVLVGTEAVLHAAGRADVVVVLDIDGELLAPRMRSADAVVALVIRSARLVGPTGRVLLVTRQPEHPVLRAMSLADGAGLSSLLTESLGALGYAPPAVVARVSGAGAPAVAEALVANALSGVVGGGVQRIGPPEGPYLLRAASIEELGDALADVDRPPARVRVEVEPVRW